MVQWFKYYIKGEWVIDEGLIFNSQVVDSVGEINSGFVYLLWHTECIKFHVQKDIFVNSGLFVK